MRFLLALLPAILWGQLPSDPAAIAKGEVLYRNTCAGCHGPNLRGGEGPNLFHSRMVVGGPPRNFFSLLSKGRPNTEMIPFRLPEEQLWQIVAYVYSHTRPGLGPPVPGDVAAGEHVFEQAGCRGCHMVSGKGGVLGPDLSSLGLRMPAEKIRESIVNPSAEIAEGYSAVRITLRTGQSMGGTLRNHDNFSYQVLRQDGEYALIDHAEASKIERLSHSLMPATTGLSPEQLQNLVAFLHRQRAPILKFPVTFFNY
ncbi:MAG: c-type cytochrome [Acidobacteria bacterium]|nr:c-type cytochrome [Acidobacteriota bacterium]